TLKALEKDRDRRYQSATALEEDIDRYLAGDPITAKAPSAIDYLKRFARKHKAAAVSIAAIFVVLVGAVIAISSIAVELSVQRNTAESAVDKAEQLAKSEAKHRKIAQEQAHEAEQAQQHVLLAAYQGNIHAAAEALSNNSLYDVRRKLADAERMVEIQQLKAGRAGPSNGFVLEGIPQDQLPFEWQYLHARADDAIATLRGHEDAVVSVTFSPDGQRLASGGDDQTIRLWETRSLGQIAQDRRHTQKEMLRLTPLVETWVEKSGGDDELVIAMLDREVKNRSPKEVTTLRNLVLKKLVQQRQAKSEVP
ncbi:MAG: hypothetical protein QF360_10865, partial [Phycisphaerales bacterium]|nr:hypothetical protein [Phycisphaerales bacterium]